MIGAPWVTTRPLLADALAGGRELEALFDDTGHLTPLGNQVAFQAFADGLRRTYAGRPGAPALSAAGTERTVLRGARAEARYECGARPQFPEARDRGRLCVRVGRKGPTEVHYRLDGRARWFHARARLIGEERAGPGAVGLTVLADGEVVSPRRILVKGEEYALRVDLAGRDAMTVVVDDGGDGARGDALALAGARFVDDG